MRVLVIDTAAPEGIAYLKDRRVRVDQVVSTLQPDQLYERIADYEAIITRSSTAVTAEFVARARNLRVLGRAGVGVDNIDILLDEDVPPEVMEEVEKAVEADSVRLIHLAP